MIKKFLQGVMALLIAVGCLVFVSNVTATDAPTLKQPVVDVQIDAQKYYTDVVAADMVARKNLPIYTTINGDKQTKQQITANQFFKIKEFDVNIAGVPYYEVDGGYIKAAKSDLVIPQAMDEKNYFITQPGKVFTATKIKTFTGEDLKTVQREIKKNKKLRVDQLVWSATGEPLFKTNAGWIPAKKNLVKDVPEYRVPATAASSYDMTTGKFMYSKNLHKRLPNASTTKLMTLYLTEKHMRATGADWNTKITIDRSVARLSHAFYGEIPMKTGEVFTLKQLYECALIKSSNEAATALGIWVAGDNQKFIAMMNEQAQAWGMKDTHYYTSSGLDVDDVAKFKIIGEPGTSKTAHTYSSVHDLTILAEHYIQEYPDVLTTASIPKAKIKGITIRSTNWLIKGRPLYDKKAPVDGLKTGTTPKAGEVLVATGQKQGYHRIITVVMHANQDRYIVTKNMMLNAYARFAMK
ncbi:D-alanyl-D-alanine carboxypeptidase [Periweissella cryptocerci]|uniref:D-alanyl-D-alanine carboxypeptidase n=1 Tax=Periweissella cryptocerci TaxID=2506420 RepID=A0A4P6YV15_9LACO|nr:DUF5776 domain-containing protein [Periweissella cryptocerci]QBO36644.1 D-alanyl-D-alanine carboxypeptidase [Periweissella cryptocerci]